MNLAILWFIIIFIYIILILPDTYPDLQKLEPNKNVDIESIYEEILNYKQSSADITRINQESKICLPKSTSQIVDKLQSVNIEPIYNIEFCKTPHKLEDKMMDIDGPLFPGSKDMNGVEKICKTALEVYFHKPFIQTRKIEWLKNPHTGNALELDCYNEELKLALEYQGPTHYIWPNRFQKTPNSRYQFDLALERDENKKRLCKKNNVVLIEVNYKIDNSLIPRFIFNTLDSLGYRSIT